MSYFFNCTIQGKSFEDVVALTTQALKDEGFGIITQIDMKETMKKKIDKDMLPYLILGACNPNFAWQALQHESHIGVFLPCNVIVAAKENGSVEVAAVDPVASMMAIENPGLGTMAAEVQQRMKQAIARIS